MTMIMGGRSFKIPLAFLTLLVLVHFMRLALADSFQGLEMRSNEESVVIPMAFSLHGGAKMKKGIAATGKEFTAATKQVM